MIAAGIVFWLGWSLTAPLNQTFDPSAPPIASPVGGGGPKSAV
jgi:hypothetical protein